jgi:hypothetical protein
MYGTYDGNIAAVEQGLIAGSRVAGNFGWRAIEALAPGDRVLTFDRGMQEITEIRRTSQWAIAPETAQMLLPLVVPVATLDDRAELVLLPDQGVMVESDVAQDLLGVLFVVSAACALVGIRGITRLRPYPLPARYVHAGHVSGAGYAKLSCDQF